MSELKHIDFKEKEFEANGRKYYVQLDGISIGRFMHYETLVNKVTFGTDFMGMFETLKRIYVSATDGMNVLKALKDIGDLSYNQMAVIKDHNESKFNQTILLCTLFLNRSDEDLTTWDERLASDKIEDWKAEGIDMNDFFLLALRQIEGFREAYWSPLLEALEKSGEKVSQEETA
jgi:hypothetical protein